MLARISAMGYGWYVIKLLQSVHRISRNRSFDSEMFDCEIDIKKRIEYEMRPLIFFACAIAIDLLILDSFAFRCKFTYWNDSSLIRYWCVIGTHF